MATSAGLPARLCDSARPRWSHRDPVEGGNPFDATDRRHHQWQEATAVAVAALRQHDAGLDAAPPDDTVPGYRTRLIELAVFRFDTWARRGRSVVSTDAERRAYAEWLRVYVDNWLPYVAETCPHVDVEAELRERLIARASHWSSTGTAGQGAHGAPPPERSGAWGPRE